MNSLIRIILLLFVFTTLTNCKRLVNKDEAYLQAESTPKLKEIEGKDLPRTSNNLDIPEITTSSPTAAPDSRPPEMAFARRRSADENVVIIESQGMPTIELFNEKDAWELITADHGINWQLLDEDADNCQATFRFYDPISNEIENKGFFKRLFKAGNTNYVDRSGEYLLTCLKLPQKQQIWLQTIDFTAPSSYVVDDLFSQIYDDAIK